jgi:arylsulfatase
MLLTGNDNHEVGLGSMAELLTPEQRGRPGYEGYLNRRAATLAERLREGGYRTYMAGKWHLGLAEDQSPAARGFERSFALLQGVHNHYGIDQGAAWQAAGVSARYREDGLPATYPEGAYSSDHFADRLTGYLREGRDDPRPFLAYLAFTAPHWPLQAPEATVARYRGRYDAGPEALRQERLRRQRALGLVKPGTEPFAPVGVPDWASLPAEERAAEARKMEVHAAMVEELDRNVGRVVRELAALGELRDTTVVFLADNGPEASRISQPSARDPALLPALGLDNSLGNIGRANSWLTYGPGWAQAASAPSRLFKGFTTEGGTRVVGFASGRGVRGVGRVSGAFLHVMDVAPTVLDLAGVPASGSYGGQPVLAPEGRSWAGLLRGRELEVRGPRATVGWELFFRRAVREGDWKAVYAPGNPLVPYQVSATAPGAWELFDLRRDPGETTDLAGAHPRRLERLVRAWDAYAERNGVVVPPPAVTPGAQAAAPVP